MRSSLLGQDAALILGLLGAMHRDPELADAVREQVLEAKREVFGAVIARAVARGDVPAAADGALLAEICSAVLFSRLLVTGEPLDDAFTQHLVDAVLLPALGRPSPMTSRQRRISESLERSYRMWQAIVFGFLGGVLAANGYPHFTRGITKKRYPSRSATGRFRTWSRAGCCSSCGGAVLPRPRRPASRLVPRPGRGRVLRWDSFTPVPGHSAGPSRQTRRQGPRAGGE